MGHAYALDDHRIISDNAFTHAGFRGVISHLTTSYWEGNGVQLRSYRPLSPVTFALEAGFGGVNPAVSHLINLLLYAITGVLFFRLVRLVWGRVSQSPGDLPGFLATLLFLAHPIHTEAVANVKGRDTMLELVFLIAATIFLFLYLNRRKPGDLFLSALFFLFALLSKESAIGFIFMVVVILLLFDDRPVRKRLFLFALYLVPLALFLILFFTYTGSGSFNVFTDLDNMLVANVSWNERMATTLFILGKYLQLLFFPHPLRYDYSYQTLSFTGFTDPVVWIILAVYLSMAGFMMFVLIKKAMGRMTHPLSDLVTFTIGWFLMGFAATSNLFFYIGSTMAERFMYVPSAGFIMFIFLVPILALSRSSLPEKRQQILVYSMYGLTGIIAVVFAVLTIDRNRDWKDDFTICTADLRNLKSNAKANFFVSDMYKRLGDESQDEATRQEYYRKAIDLKERADSIHQGIPGLNGQLGFLYVQTGQPDSAIRKYIRAIESNPEDVFNYIQLYRVFGKSGRFGEGRPWLDRAESIAPQNTEILLLQGAGWFEEDSATKAIYYFNRVLAIDPANPPAKQYLDRIVGKKKPGSGQTITINNQK